MCSQNKLNLLLNETAVGLQKIFGENLKSIILYGSYARGDFDDESDIDIMALINLEKSELSKYRRIVSDFANDIDLKYGVLLSIKLQDKFTFDKYANALAYYKNVAREGVVIDV